MRGALALLVWIAVALPAVATPVAEAKDQAARLPDGRTLNLYCAGKGAPTVILESGWSGDSRGWPRVQGPLSAHNHVCAYDRAGSGKSDAGPLPRDGKAIAKDLDDALRAARIAGPFIVVGHSTGGLYVRHFANRRPSDVVGMLLVDSSIEHQQQRHEAAFGPGAGSLDPLLQRSRACLAAAKAGTIPADEARRKACQISPPASAAMGWEARLSELETLSTTTSTDLDAGRRLYGAMPLVTLTATRGMPPEVSGILAGLHREIAMRSRCFDARIVADSGHLMMKDRPDAIVRAVQDLMSAHDRKTCPFPSEM